eukprot:CAMPEP_0197052224 /NCGR_PEP_ID=MMETSP1384-20130603/26734_1 /TAXON_ID=29189 /ORGANISM="Ammonia sp." /LENGTH=67 /DNA_ID=CAMNT_0042484897 /DNA_START=88 /DNA_END=288 /DNA_ORIENTATION=-
MSTASHGEQKEQTGLLTDVRSEIQPLMYSIVRPLAEVPSEESPQSMWLMRPSSKKLSGVKLDEPYRS